MQRPLTLTILLITLLPLTAGHTGAHDETVNTTATEEHTETAPAPVGHTAAVDRSTALGAAVLVLLTISVSVLGIHRYARRRT